MSSARTSMKIPPSLPHASAVTIAGATVASGFALLAPLRKPCSLPEGAGSSRKGWPEAKGLFLLMLNIV